MVDETERLVLQMSADIRRFEKQMERANAKFTREVAAIEKKARDSDKRLAQFGSTIGTGLGRLSGTAAVAFGAIAAYSTKAAADAVELRDAFRIAFGEGAKGAETYAKTLSDQVGRSQLEIMESMTRFRLLLKDQDAATAEAITRELQARAIDVGSLFNLQDAEVIQKFFSGISGEAEPLKALGVNLNEAALKAELLRLGFKGSTAAASEQAKQIARANIIMRETQIAASNAADTIDSTSNRMKQLQGETRDAAAAFGEQFLPIANQVLQWATDALEAFNRLPDGTKAAGLGMLALVAAGGPIVGLISGLARLIKYAAEARVAMLALGGASAAGGAGAAAGAGAGAATGARGLAGRIGVAGAAVGIGYLGYQSVRQGQDNALVDRLLSARNQRMNPNTGTFDNPALREASEEELARALQRVQADPGNYTWRTGGYEKALKAEIERRGATAVTAVDQAAAAAAAAATANMGSFGLSDTQRAPTGGAGGAGGGRGGRGTREIDRLAEEMARAQENTDRALHDAAERLLGIRLDAAVGAEERLRLELHGVEMEREARRADLAAQVRQNDLSQAQADQIDQAEEAVRLAAETNLRKKGERDLQDERLTAERHLTDMTVELLGIRSSMAETAGERRTIELQLLQIHQAERRAALERLAASEDIAEAQREAARVILANLKAQEDAETSAVKAANRSPLEQWRSESLNTPAKMQEALEQVAVDGLDALNDGLVDAIMNTKSLGEVFADVADQITRELLKIAVRRAIIEPLANMLFKPGGGGPGIPGFAQGGIIRGPGTGTSDSVLARLSAGEFVSTAKATKQYLPLLEAMNRGKLPGFAKGGLVDLGRVQTPVIRSPVIDQLTASMGKVGRAAQPVTQTFHVNAQGAILSDSLMKEMKAHADQRAATAYSGAVNDAQVQMWDQFQRRHMFSR